MEIDKEIQKNEWFAKLLEEELKVAGYEMPVYGHNEYCIFGKSRLDIIFTRKKANCLEKITAGIVMQPESGEVLNIEVSGGTIEYKMKDP